MYVKFIRLDVPNSAIEVTWFEDTETEQKPVKCVTYGAEQCAEFEAEVDGAANYVGLIQWTTP